MAQYPASEQSNSGTARRRKQSVISEGGGLLLLNINDVPRMLLLFLMLLATFIGYFINTSLDSPERVVRKSFANTAGKQFMASIEGGVAAGGTALAVYRMHQHYDPESGITDTKEPMYRGGEPSLNAASALALLADATHVEEYRKEDMYGSPTRHFSGVVTVEREGGARLYMFEYWVHMRNVLPVRLFIRTPQQSKVVDIDGKAVPQEERLNIRYFNWR